MLRSPRIELFGVGCEVVLFARMSRWIAWRRWRLKILRVGVHMNCPTKQERGRRDLLDYCAQTLSLSRRAGLKLSQAVRGLFAVGGSARSLGGARAWTPAPSPSISTRGSMPGSPGSRPRRVAALAGSIFRRRFPIRCGSRNSLTVAAPLTVDVCRMPNATHACSLSSGIK